MVSDDLGRVSTVTQYTTPAGSTVVNEVKNTYDDWGMISKIEQDHDSAVGADSDLIYDVDFAYEKATSGRNTIRRTSMDLPNGDTVNYSYRSTSGSHDYDASRVSQVGIDAGSGNVIQSTYEYNGVGHVVGTDLDPVDVMWHQYTTSGTYPDLDRFDRVTSSRWTKDLSTDRDFYDVDITVVLVVRSCVIPVPKLEKC